MPTFEWDLETPVPVAGTFEAEDAAAAEELGREDARLTFEEFSREVEVSVREVTEEVCE